MTDSVTEAISAAGTAQHFAGNDFVGRYFGTDLAIAAYMASGMLQKAIEIPASDRVREWRDWQADAKDIEAIEAEERRLGLIAKVRQAEILRGLGGAALILVTAGNHDQPLNPASVAKDGLIAVNVVNRRQITAEGWYKDLASADYGLPTMWKLSSEQGAQTRIHPSRVICFRGDVWPSYFAHSDEDAFWGLSRVSRIWREVERSDRAQAWFSELVKKAKLLRIGIPELTDFTATPGGQEKLNRRMSAIALGEGILNATVYDAGTGGGRPAETITDYQVTWAGIPAMMDAFDQRVAAVSDIPFTRLMGRSPAGMNATGQHDTDNWNRTVSTGQALELRPCLEALDPILLRSAGVADPAKVTWKFAPLWTPTEAEEATTFKTTMEAVEKLQATGAIPEVAFNKGVQNLMSERQYVPGLDQALSEIPEDERFGLNPDDDGSDPSAIQAKGGDPESQATAGGDGSAPARRAANDAAPRSLYVSRKVKNVGDLQAWAKSQGLPDLQDDLHVTIAYSTTPVDWIKMGGEWGSDEDGGLTVPAGGPRLVEPLGDRTAVLLFASSGLSYRNMSMREAGASWDHSDYQPHISLTGDPVDLANVEPYRGPIEFGPEIFEEID